MAQPEAQSLGASHTSFSVSWPNFFVVYIFDTHRDPPCCYAKTLGRAFASHGYCSYVPLALRARAQSPLLALVNAVVSSWNHQAGSRVLPRYGDIQDLRNPRVCTGKQVSFF
ncbi:Hypothetical predicted protein [Marmota monax]|uniref:Uncharacterized protein n=1 Tax=Marmota monax TaxID=9995 RepID=A0A5E4A5Y0_MARMO|nr:hypothetical protein GHT09_009953 [Marmota monax]VTJ52528.1 Hypothetical predicted protein [Marmota monax]